MESNTDSTESKRVGASRLGYRRETEMKNPDGWRSVGDGWGKEEPPRSGFFNCGDADEDMVGVEKSASNL